MTRIHHGLLLLFTLSLLCYVVPPTFAQQDEGAIVEVAASDGLTLYGRYFSAADTDSGTSHPAVIIVIDPEDSLSTWLSAITALQAAGYEVLVTDLRGEGGLTEGQIDSVISVADTRTWVEWMLSQPGIAADRLALIGSRIGSPHAIAACGQHDSCRTVIALSPTFGWQEGCDTSSCNSIVNDYGEASEFLNDAVVEAVSEQLEQRSILLIGSQSDPNTTERLKYLVNISTGEIAAYLSPGVQTAGALVMGPSGRRTIPLITNWLNNHLPAPR